MYCTNRYFSRVVNTQIIAFLFLFILTCLATASATEKDPLLGKTILRIHGSNTIGAKLGPDIAQRFLKNHAYKNIHKVPGEKENEFFIVASKDSQIYNIEIKAHGSSTSFKSLEAGLCDVGMASRKIKDKEVKKLAFLGDLTSVNNEHVLAIDGIAVIVNKKNSLNMLDVGTIHKIFTGQISNWKELGGANLPIQVYARDNNSGTFDTFKSMVLKKTPLVSTAKRYESNAMLSQDVTADPSGIGFVGMPYVLQSKALMVKKTEDSAGYLPTTFTAAYEEYPLSRRLYLYTAENPSNPLAKEFADFALSYKGQKSVALLGFAKLSMDMEERDPTVDRFQNDLHNKNYTTETLGGRRVNFNFRFQAGDYSLENRSQKDLQRFIRYIQEPDQRYYEALLIGINSCYQTEAMITTIIETIGRENFHVPPKKLCLDYAANKSGKQLESLIEVWLRVVDDGA
jgi:phosphate transport system substrate-binding protein